VTRKVIEIEEAGFYQGLEMDENFPLYYSPQPRDLGLPRLPATYRLREVEVVLSGSPMTKVLLFCKKRQRSIDRRVLLSECICKAGQIEVLLK
jgi:hypothetical protein